MGLKLVCNSGSKGGMSQLSCGMDCPLSLWERVRGYSVFAFQHLRLAIVLNAEPFNQA
ncbi:hypothetical protein FHU10_2387 [Serratia fonticola]|jgi:hypothetical protein|uniref:Uncharacterized protein n=1 Tax=Serratia fonticola TaxID=47917 RepID=A0A559T5H0_SERFO|nr:hypothetical protein FHU09_0065 [Serratia fonticola]TQI95359.1 hypothetical protein FHU11_0729 [Serratia fonticola]TVZ69854.1 hypothetical protein FHU10_2387 [Serratia fonticola]